MVGADPEARPRAKAARRKGFAPRVLLTQVESTAGWALASALEATELPPTWARRLGDAPLLEARWQEADALPDYLGLLLSAHFATVATFVPTDVDAHIRHHVWQEIEDPAMLAACVARIDEAATWDVTLVSARPVRLPFAHASGELVHGHAGEWLSVRAGALARALTLGARELVEKLRHDIDAELAHEAVAFDTARARAHRGPEESRLALELATTMAHNAGDLSRVVEAWPRGTPEREEHVARYCRLGHVDSARLVEPFRLAGLVNKAVMADENHRHLALRAPRALRSSRALLLPLGPWFDAWGGVIGKSAMSPEDKADVLAALLDGFERAPLLHGYLRAIRGIHEHVPGGLGALERDLPARLRKHVQKGPVRDALRLDEDRFAARMHNAWRAAVSAAG